MTAAIFAGTAVLAAYVFCLLLAASAACAWLSSPDSTLGELAADIVLGATALAVGITSTLLVAGVANLASVTAAMLALGAAALAWGGRASLRRLHACWQAGLRALRRSPMLWLLPAVATCMLARGLALPQLAWDGLTYHLTYPASWLEHGGVVRFDGGGIWEAYETFPKGGESLFYLAMLPFGRDFLVNLVNLPLWLGLALAVRACAQRLCARRSMHDGYAVAVVACPAFSAYVTPAYVEVGTALAFACALLAAIRALRGDSACPLTLLWLGAGTAIAFKLTMLPLLGGALIVSLLCARRAPDQAARSTALGALLGGLVCAPWFVRNAVACGNPLYPAPLPGFEQGPGAGSLLLRWTLQESSVLSQHAVGRVIQELLAPPWQPYPLGPLALYPVALGVPVLCLYACSPAQRRRVLLLLVVALYLLGVYLLSPWNGIYVNANTRFLGPSFIAAALATSVALDALPTRPYRALGLPLLGLSLAYLVNVPSVRDFPWRAPSLPLALALTGWLGVQSVLVGSVHVPSRALRLIGALCAAAAIALLPSALHFREQHRLQSYVHAVDLHPVRQSSKELWPLVAALPPSRIAFTVGGVDSTEGWFFYPLFGADLRHRVRYVDIERDGERSACMRRGLIRSRPDFAAWMQRLRSQHIDYLVVQADPLEAQWAQANPDRFALVSASHGGQVFRVLPASAQPAPGR
jgi:hypothetical protein